MNRWTTLVVLGAIGTTVACSSAGGSADTTIQPSTGADNGVDIESGPDVDETGDDLKTPMWFAIGDTVACPTGATFDATSGFCTQGGRALGPFPAAMVTACKSAGGASCDDVNWDLATAKQVRGQDTCPAGSSIHETLGVCSDGTFAYGPFPQTMADDCAMLGGGDSCSGLRFDLKFVPELPADDVTDGVATQGAGNNCSQLNARMFANYGTRAGYDSVSRAAMRVLHTRHNGCATWLSEAIRAAGGNVPVNESTNGLRDALKARGWTVIRNRSDLQPGDVIITHDRAGVPGHPDHVYMFGGWAGSNPKAVDNQGFMYARTPGRSPIAYGLRAPGGSSGGSCGTTKATPSDSTDAGPTLDSCANKADGWYCSEYISYGAFECSNHTIAGGWQCGGGTVCRPNGSGHATLSGQNPGCFGSR